MFILMSALTLKQVVLVANCKTAREMIEKLNSFYANVSEFNKMALHETFHRFKMVEEDGIAQHIAKVQEKHT